MALLTLFFCVFTMHAQDILWEKSYGGKHAEYLFDAIPTPDYGFILAGSSISNKNGNKSDNNKGDLDYWVWKMDERGGLDWQKSFGGSGTDLLQSIKLTNDGGFILAGTSTSNKSEDKKDNAYGDADFWIIKLDAKGGVMWQKTIGGTGQEKLQSIACTKDGGYIIGGSSSSDKVENDKEEINLHEKTEKNRGNLDYWVVKLSVNGTPEWQKTIGGKYFDELKSIEQTTDGGYILGGYSNSPVSGDKTSDNFGLGDYWIVKLDESGNITWQKTIGGDKDDNLFTLIQTKDKGFLLGGNSNSNATNSKKKGNGKGTDFWVVKLDETGDIVWQETYDYGKVDVLTSIVENEDHTFLIGGYAQSEIRNQKSEISKSSTSKNDKEGINDYIALKIKDNGEEVWTQTVGSKGDEVMKKLLETRDGGYLLAGTSKGGQSRDKGSSIGGNDFWVVKLKDKEKKQKTKTAVEAYPNPAESFTNTLVNYDYNDGWATLYDLNGRQLQKIELHGEHTVPIQLGNIPSGVYLVNIKTNNGEDSVKIIKN
ncbi:Por secretion system C-terminal sorting domain-containing protein [Flavobacterium terrae]|uniref:Por secretion system C-terminal sorting domain-containing protein n=1 Tax=Flavobacterium terrae TaxID=415425 RepID=A0A1M6CUS1_9FLAO|nr:Por secretion system C-terminal sorting domain-containing protein [Flavobacterium terrae]